MILLTGVSTFLAGYCYKKRDIWIKLCFLTMALVGGFRYQVGIDYISYENIFFQDNIVGYNKSEIGYKLLLYIAYYVNGTPQMVFLFASCLTCYFVYKFVEMECDNKPLSTIIYLCLGPMYFFSWNGVREGIAISIFLYALHYLEKDWKKYIVVISLAGLFHYSVFAFIFLLAFRHLKRSCLFYMAIGTLIVFPIVRYDIISFVIQRFIPRYGNILVWEPSMDFSYYIMLFSVIIILIIKKYLIKDNLYEKYYFLLTIMGILIFGGLASKNAVGIFIRFVSYCVPCLMVILPAVGCVIKQRWFYNIFLCLACYIYYFYIINVGKAMLPYQANFVLFM